MSKFVVDLDQKNKRLSEDTPAFLAEQAKPHKSSIFAKILKIFAVLILFIVVIAGIGGFFYWQSVKTSPQYSLALLVDAARHDDQAKINELVDTDAVVDDFLPQITNKAIELYGRGLPENIVQKATQIAEPLMPAVKERAKAELPELIRDKTKKFDNIPFWAIAIGAEEYLDIKEEGDEALIKSKMENRPLEIKLKRQGQIWRVVAVKDEVLARKIADKIGQEIIALAKRKDPNNLNETGKELGVGDLKDLVNEIEGIFKQ